MGIIRDFLKRDDRGFDKDRARPRDHQGARVRVKPATTDDNQQDKTSHTSSPNVRNGEEASKNYPPSSSRDFRPPSGLSNQPQRRASQKTKQRQTSQISSGSGSEPLSADSESKTDFSLVSRENEALREKISALEKDLNEMEARHLRKPRQSEDGRSLRPDTNQQYYTDKIEGMKKRHMTEISALNKREQQKRSLLEKQLENAQLEHRKKLLEQAETQREQENVRLQELRLDKEGLREQLKLAQVKVERADEELEIEKKKLRKRADDELRDASRTYMLQLEALEKTKDMEMQALVGQHNVDLIEKDKELRSKLESQALAFNLETEQRQRDFQSRLDGQHDELVIAKENAVGWKDFSARAAEDREAAVKSLEIAETQRQAQLRDADIWYQKNLQEQSTRHLEQVAANKTRHDEEIKRLQDTHHQKVESLTIEADDERRQIEDYYEKELGALKKRLETAEGRFVAKYDAIIQGLKQEHQVAESQLKEKHGAEIETLVDSMNKEREESQRRIQDFEGRVASLLGQMEAEACQFKDVVDSVQTQHSTKMLEQRSYYKNILADLKKQHETAQAIREAKLKDEAARSLKDIKEQNSRLRADLLTPKRKQQAWTDEMLKIKFQDLKQLIEDMVSPHQLDKGKLYNAAQSIDFKFLESRGTEMNLSHYLVKSRVWEILHYAFFSLPFGFGAFGVVKGGEPVIALYEDWRMILYGQLGKLDRKNGLEESFRKDPSANIFRSALFQTLVASADGSAGLDNPTAMPAINAQELQQRCKEAARDMLMDFLAPLAKSDAESSEMAPIISDIADRGLELGLQFGVHPAELSLLRPKKGESLEVGAECNNCLGENLRRGGRECVALVVAPGICRTGDGKRDTGSKVTIVPCDIFPVTRPDVEIAGSVAN